MGTTVGDLLDYTTKLIDALKRCNNQIEAQNEWFKANGES